MRVPQRLPQGLQAQATHASDLCACSIQVTKTSTQYNDTAKLRHIGAVLRAVQGLLGRRMVGDSEAASVRHTHRDLLTLPHADLSYMPVH